jgi:hypothetical protein
MFENMSALGYAMLCLLLVLIVSLAFSLVAAYRKRGAPARKNGFSLFRNAKNTVRRPWAEEDDALLELSRRVDELKHDGEQAQPSRDKNQPQ